MEFALCMDTSGEDPEVRARGWIMDQEKTYNDLVAKADSMAKKKQQLRKELEKLEDDEKALQEEVDEQKKKIRRMKENFDRVDFWLLRDLRQMVEWERKANRS